MSGRKKDNVWLHFNEKKSVCGKFNKAICKMCNKESMGIVARMKKHLETCQAKINTDQNEDSMQVLKVQNKNPPASVSEPSESSAGTSSMLMAHQSTTPTRKRKLDEYLFKTDATQKQLLHMQTARYFYATNTPFRHVENEQFKKMINMLRPGYVPPNRFDIAGKLLEGVYEEERLKCKSDLKNKTVCLSIDGWSNIHNDPIICTCLTASDGKTVLIDTIDTTDNHHTADYLETVARESIKKAEQVFECKVGSVVSDNAANMAKMRRQLQIQCDDGQVKAIVAYGCSAHILNLLAKDLELPEATAHVQKVIKYFRNNHFAHAKYSMTNANKLILPQEVRWNTMCESLKSYIDNWPTLMQIADQNKDDIDKDIRNIIQNVSIKRNAEDLVARLEPISNALDNTQSDKCCISECVLIWKNLTEKLEEILNVALMKKVMARYRQAMTPAHFLAYMINPKMPQERLTSTETEEALSFLQNNYGYTGESLLNKVIQLNARTEPFTGVLMNQDLINKTNTLEWWQAIFNMKKCITQEEFEIIKQLATAIASSAGVERIFSAFNIVHSKLRNKLGTEKAAKLVFLVKSLNE